MSSAVDILLLLPEVAEIGHADLQRHCNEWLQRPIAREYGVAQLNVAPRLTLQVLLDQHAFAYAGEVGRVNIWRRRIEHFLQFSDSVTAKLVRSASEVFNHLKPMP